jgi:hypothetical protein
VSTVRALRRKPSIAEQLQSIQLRTAQPLQIDDADDVRDRRCGIAGKLHSVAVASGAEPRHQPFSSIKPNATVIGLQSAIIGYHQQLICPCFDLLASRLRVCGGEPTIAVVEIPSPDRAGTDADCRIGSDLGQSLARRKPPEDFLRQLSRIAVLPCSVRE